jgi:glycerate kinase
VLIPQRLLVVSGVFGPRIDAKTVANGIARGVTAAGRPEPDVCPIEPADEAAQDARGLLDVLDFDARMRASRAVVVACERLRERALAGSLTFEIATRARQGGVPAYAVTAENRLDAFDARILDLQAIIEARTVAALASAGGKLASLAWPPA